MLQECGDTMRTLPLGSSVELPIGIGKCVRGVQKRKGRGHPCFRSAGPPATFATGALCGAPYGDWKVCEGCAETKREGPPLLQECGDPMRTLPLGPSVELPVGTGKCVNGVQKR